MVPDIGFCMQAQYCPPITTIVDLAANAGFSAISPVWAPDLDFDAFATRVYRNNMIIHSVHAPHKGIPDLWDPTSVIGADACGNIKRCIDTCANFQVPILVVHGWQGLFYTFPKEPLNFHFFNKIVDYAQQKGVSVAFENLEGEEYLAALMTRYKNQGNVGFCWDSGHDHCYPHRTDFLKTYGDRLIMTHINDNFGLRASSGIPSGKDDLHLIPYDGTIDWQTEIQRLKICTIQQRLNFEIKLNDCSYQNLSLEQFFEKAGKQARKLATLLYP